MKTIVYEKVLHNFNKIVQEKYPNVIGMRVSEMPWRDSWKQCEAAPSGQNTIHHSLSLTEDLFLSSVIYDELPFLDDISDVKLITSCLLENVNYTNLPPITKIERAFIRSGEKTKIVDITQLQRCFGETLGDLPYSAINFEINSKVPDIEVTGSLILKNFSGNIHTSISCGRYELVAPKSSFYCFSGLFKHNITGKYQDCCIIDKNTFVPKLKGKRISFLPWSIISNEAVFCESFKCKILEFSDVLFLLETPNLFYKNGYETLVFEDNAIDGIGIRDFLIGFNGEIVAHRTYGGISSYPKTAQETLNGLGKEIRLKSYDERREIVLSAMAERNASLACGGF